MKANIEYDYTRKCSIHFEHIVNVGDSVCFLLFGHHAKGGFISIPNWNICCEATDLPNSLLYNTDKLISAGLDRDVAEALATYISNWQEKNRKKRI